MTSGLIFELHIICMIFLNVGILGLCSWVRCHNV